MFDSMYGQRKQLEAVFRYFDVDKDGVSDSDVGKVKDRMMVVLMVIVMGIKLVIHSLC